MWLAGQRLDRLARMGQQFDRVLEHLAPRLESLADRRAGTRASVTSIAVSIIDSTKPLMP